MDDKIEELVKYLNSKMEAEERTVSTNRYLPGKTDYNSLSLIKDEQELRKVIKVAVARGYLAAVELGGISYRLTKEGQDLALGRNKENNNQTRFTIEKIENNGHMQVGNNNSQSISTKPEQKANIFVRFINSKLFVAIISVIFTAVAGVIAEIFIKKHLGQ